MLASQTSHNPRSGLWREDREFGGFGAQRVRAGYESACRREGPLDRPGAANNARTGGKTKKAGVMGRRLFALFRRRDAFATPFKLSGLNPIRTLSVGPKDALPLEERQVQRARDQ